MDPQGMLLIEEDEAKRLCVLHYEGSSFIARSDESWASMQSTGRRIALCVNLHARQTPAEIADSARTVFLAGIEHGIDRALGLTPQSSPEHHALKLDILNKVRLEMMDQQRAISVQRMAEEPGND